MRPGEPPALEAAETLFNNLFFDSGRYDLSAVGRIKLNERLDLEHPIEQRTLTKEDILRTVDILLKLRLGVGDIDDIDNLSNRRVRAVGELLENQYRIGLLRIERAIEKDFSLLMLILFFHYDFINNKPASAVVKGILRKFSAFTIHGSNKSSFQRLLTKEDFRIRSRWSFS